MLVMQVRGARFIREYLYVRKCTESPLDKRKFHLYVSDRAIDQIQWFERVKSWKFPGNTLWTDYQIESCKNLDLSYLELICSLLVEKQVEKCRIDSVNHEIRFYFADQSSLMTFLEKIPEKFHNCLLRLENSLLTSATIKPNQIIVKTRKTPRFKVFIRNQNQVDISHCQLLNYLRSQGDLVRIPAKMLETFSTENLKGYFYNLYFYTDDLSLLNFVQLIAPGIIGRIQEILEEKEI
jgi:hypothetical protein